MTNHKLNEIVKPQQRDYGLANRSLKLRREADRLSVMAIIAPDKSMSRKYERRAEELIRERREVVAQISPAGVNYNF